MRRKKLSKQHRRNISRSLKNKSSKSRKGAVRQEKRSETVLGVSPMSHRSKNRDRLKDIETISKIARNASLASETPSKIARNASVTAKNLARIPSRVDRGLSRIGSSSRSLDSISRIINRKKGFF